MNLLDARRVHFIGVGGAGMSAIAKVLMERGVDVSGSDLKRSRAATVLEAMGATVLLDGHDAGLVTEGDVVVVSSAIPEGNPELVRARELGNEIVSRGSALAALLAASDSIVVAGTHGKTTTTSMITSVLRSAGTDPTYLIGGGLNESGTNARFGRGRFAVAESDESDGSFLLLSPFIGVVTNVEADHVDHYGSFKEVRRAFSTFIGQCATEGAVVIPADDRELGRSANGAVLTFGQGGAIVANDIVLENLGARFAMGIEGEHVEVELQVPGRHNVSNALAAAAACTAAGLSPPEIARGLGAFRGVERRFQVRGRARGVTVVDDYAHHPTEVKATLAAARDSVTDRGRVVAVFQPHRYSRVAALAEEFGAAFDDADNVVLTDVYGAGETPVPGVTGKLVAESVCDNLPGRPVAYVPHRQDLLTYLETHLREGDVVLTLGAGDITGVGEELLSMLTPVA
jgi:UDP-N-acetylmuramate--alanine ligase